jgi:ATP-binding cassette subfamily B protein
LTVVAIIAILIVQAYCDLALPRYTSDIVDIGIMKGGIGDAVLNEARPESMADLLMFMPEEDEAIVKSAYESGADGNLHLSVDRDDTEQIDALARAFEIPMLLFSAQRYGESGGETGDAANLPPFDIDQLRQAYTAGMLDKTQLLEIRNEAEKALGEMGDLATGAVATAYVRAEYEAIGIDMEALQLDYMKDIGLRMILLTLVSICAAIIVCFLASHTAAVISKKLRQDIFFKVLSFSGKEINKFSSASLITRSTNDIQHIQMALVMIMRVVLLAPVMGIGGIIMVLGTHTGMGWIIATAVGILLVGVVIMLSIAMPKFTILQKLIDRLNLVSREILSGLPVIRAFCREDFERDRFEKANDDLMKTQLFTNRVMVMMFPLIMLLMNVTTVVIVWVSAAKIDLGDLQVGAMMAFITYTMQIVMSFLMLSMIAVMLPRANVAAERVHEVLSTKLSVLDKSESERVRRAPEDWKGLVSFNDVSFRFPDAEADVLMDINFTAQPGETTAIIGSTGSGKSTLVNLIPRLFDVTAGSITIDGVDIRDIAQHALREILGVVPQKGVLFSGDIRSNIKFGNADISDGVMNQAADIAQAADFIGEKEDGYESAISQGGTNVSGGQKQRLSIARAIAHNPKIFIFDDSFSALDYRTDIKLRKALNTNLHDATVIIVAQRISTILRAEKIIVLDEGRIAGIGTHEALLKNCSVYREIASSQLSETELGA